VETIRALFVRSPTKSILRASRDPYFELRVNLLPRSTIHKVVHNTQFFKTPSGLCGHTTRACHKRNAALAHFCVIRKEGTAEHRFWLHSCVTAGAWPNSTCLPLPPRSDVPMDTFNTVPPPPLQINNVQLPQKEAEYLGLHLDWRHLTQTHFRKTETTRNHPHQNVLVTRAQVKTLYKQQTSLIQSNTQTNLDLQNITQQQQHILFPKATRGFQPIIYRGVLLSARIHAIL
jgi:hypothetical protein